VVSFFTILLYTLSLKTIMTPIVPLTQIYQLCLQSNLA